MLNVSNELIASSTSDEDYLIQWKHDTKSIFSCFKNF